MKKRDSKISNYLAELQISCPRHESFLITHGCFNVDCTKEMLFCSSCLLENLSHITEHQRFISPMPNFINEFYSHLSAIKENLKPLEEMNYFKDNNLENWYLILKERKQNFNNEMNRLKVRIDNIIEQTKEEFNKDSNRFLKDVEECYQNINDISGNGNLLDFNFRSKEEFIQKIRRLRIDEINDFFLEMRNSLKFLRKPVNPKIMKNYVDFSQKLESCLNDHNILSVKLDENIERELENIFIEITDNSRKLFWNMRNQESKSSFGNTHINDNNNIKTPTKVLKTHSAISNNVSPFIIKNHSEISNSVSPLINNKSFSTYFPNKRNSEDPSASKLMSSFRNISKMSNLDMFDTPSQKNFIVKKALLDEDENASKIELKVDAFFDEVNCFSTFCLICLNENLLAAAGKDGSIRIFDYSQNLNRKSNLKLIKTLQNPQDFSPIWSLEKLSTVNYQNNDFGVFYFASGSENGIVSIWKFDNKPQKVSETQNKPLIELIGHQTIEIITAILGLNDGKHLICGDSKGSLMVWDFLYGRNIQNFDIHKDQINSIISYNDSHNVAVGSYDGNISLWQVSKGNKEDLEIVCCKIVKNNFYVYGVNTFYSRNFNIIVVDSQKKIKVLDIQKMCYINESDYLMKSESLMDVLCVEFMENNSFFPILLCFSKNQLIILNGDSLEVIKTIEGIDNFIGTTMNSNYKAVFISKKSTNIEKEHSICFGIVDQSPKTRRVITIFTVTFKIKKNEIKRFLKKDNYH